MSPLQHKNVVYHLCPPFLPQVQHHVHHATDIRSLRQECMAQFLSSIKLSWAEVTKSYSKYFLPQVFLDCVIYLSVNHLTFKKLITIPI